MIASSLRRTTLAAAAVASLSLVTATPSAAGGPELLFTGFAELKARAAAVEPPHLLVQAAAPGQDDGPSEKDIARFNFLKNRLLEKQGLPPALWKELEEKRAAHFDRRFGQGTYDAVMRFSSACLYKEGCKRLLTADLISAGYRFIDLEKDVESGAVVRGSGAYRSRDEKLKAEMREAVEEFRPKTGARKEYTESFAAFADPILNEISAKP